MELDLALAYSALELSQWGNAGSRLWEPWDARAEPDGGPARPFRRSQYVPVLGQAATATGH